MTTYKAGTLALFSPVSDDPTDAKATIIKNFDLMAPYASQAKEEGAQIMIYPESMTGSLIWPDFDRDRMAEYSEVYPEVGTQVCDDAYDKDGLYQHHRTACLAKDNAIYIVMNVPELLDCKVDLSTPAVARTSSVEEGNTRKLENTSSPAEVTCSDLTDKREYIFNTLAIYGPDGALVAKYRKTSTFLERFDNAFINKGKEFADFTTFETDFGVTFGVLICADAFNPHIFPAYQKAGIKNIIIPFYDGARVPVYSMAGVHAGDAVNYGVNVLTSQSQTFSGAGSYSAGRPLHWSMNMDPSADIIDFAVVEVPMDPSLPAITTDPKMDIQQGNATVETCRWQGGEGDDIAAPCIKVVVPPNEVTSFGQTLEQEMVIEGKAETLTCSIEASLTSTGIDETLTYAMMVGWRDSPSGTDESAFCSLVVCNAFPDCSKDCPMCVEIYGGNKATLSEFHMEASVPEYFEDGDRQMRLPQMNSGSGEPMSSEVYDWFKQDGKRYMNLKEGEQVPNLFGASAFYIGFGPHLVEDIGDGGGTPSVPDSPQTPGANTTTTSGCIASNMQVFVTALCMLVHIFKW